MLNILFEDNHLLFVLKPAGLATQPAAGCETDLETQVKAYLKEKYSKAGNVYLHAVHRLDRLVGGIVLFAKTSKALSRLNEAQRNKKIEKYYLAVCEGSFPHKEGKLEHFLIHDDFKATVGSTQDKEAKLSTLLYEVLGTKNAISLLKITLITGRYHQIRAQLQASNHPIIGDAKYGSHTPFRADAIALYHYKMTLKHPVTQEALTVEAPAPLSWPLAELWPSQDRVH